MLYDLAVYHLIDVDARQSDPSAAGPQSEPFVLMDAGSAHTRDDGVALGDLVLDGYVEIAVQEWPRRLILGNPVSSARIAYSRCWHTPSHKACVFLCVSTYKTVTNNTPQSSFSPSDLYGTGA